MLTADGKGKILHSLELLMCADIDDDDIYGAVEVIQEVLDEIREEHPKVKEIREKDTTDFIKRLGETTLSAILRRDNETARNARLRVITGQEYRELLSVVSNVIKVARDNTAKGIHLNSYVAAILHDLDLRMTWEEPEKVWKGE